MWYDVGQTLSYNCLFNFVIGARGCGKSYALKKRAIKQFINKGFQFIYLRRKQSELDETAESYFNDIIANNEFPDVKIEYKGGVYYINDAVAGYAMALSKAGDIKSISYPLVYLIIFDEFLIEENGFNRYLKNEVKQFLGFYMSIDRYRGCIVFFLSNSTEWWNPYTSYFNLTLPYGSNVMRRGDLLLQFFEDAEFVESRKQTRFGKMIEGTEFADYAIENKFVNQTNTFIRKKTEKSRYFFTFNYEGEAFGVWVDDGEGKMFVSENVDPTCLFVYSLTVEDHKPNTMLLKNLNRSPFFRPFIAHYKNGCVYYENQKIKNVCFEILRLSMM